MFSVCLLQQQPFRSWMHTHIPMFYINSLVFRKGCNFKRLWFLIVFDALFALSYNRSVDWTHGSNFMCISFTRGTIDVNEKSNQKINQRTKYSRCVQNSVFNSWAICFFFRIQKARKAIYFVVKIFSVLTLRRYILTKQILSFRIWLNLV